MRKLTFQILAAIIPPILLLVLIEGLFRAAGLGKPSLGTLALAEEYAGLLQTDRVLSWSVRPGFNGMYSGAHLSVNQFGLRGRDITGKGSNEFRILSLGESTTFGVNVSDEETYSARLETELNQRIDGIRFTVLNAGAPAYSSFQSLRYLEQRGLKLKPDLILFYHEVNDYLPSSLRDSSQNEIGVTLTDKQLYESTLQRTRSFLTEHSALFRFFIFRDAKRRIRKFNTNDLGNPLSKIGLDRIGIFPRAFSRANPSVVLNEKALGTRVSEQERRENLRCLVATCRQSGVGLIVMHPSYRDSVARECLLTQFCREYNVAMFDADGSLHPLDRPRGDLFTDAWHPNAEGHRRLAENLAAFMIERGFATRPKRDKSR